MRKYKMMEMLLEAETMKADELADISGTDFENADLTGSDMRGAKLDGAKFPGTVMDGVKK